MSNSHEISWFTVRQVFRRYLHTIIAMMYFILKFPLFLSPSTGVGDPDPYVFGPPGSGSVSQRYGTNPDQDPSIIKKNLEFYVLFCDFLKTFYL
jgi:hypothetical protein